ncbi:hypothetical protein TIFTF001_013196 [Ficus carica]|uniref:Pentatricopeptide repeat-containing protein n=1 Tax=Ficus carica TaxID=3494 RepID=A0AA88A337_FICCA|nr:hypothetical protein TIFTF001_013196 [Ficus carica]
MNGSSRLDCRSHNSVCVPSYEEPQKMDPNSITLINLLSTEVITVQATPLSNLVMPIGLRSHGQGLSRGRTENPPPSPRPQNPQATPPNPRSLPPPRPRPIQPSPSPLCLRLRVSQQNGGFSVCGPFEQSLRLFSIMKSRGIWPDEYTFAPLLKACSNLREYRMGQCVHAKVLSGDQGFEPDEATVVMVLPVCARLGAVEVGQWIHSYADSKRLLREVISVGNSLVDFYCKCGDLQSASSVFKKMDRRDVVSWNVMISGLAFNGEGQRGVELFEEMVGKGMNPNEATFVGVLACCAHAGLVEKGRHVFALMKRPHKIRPKLEHYGCLVDILGRGGSVKEAHDLIKSMPIKPNAALWGSLLGSCRTYGDLELAEIALNELINLEPWNSGNYVLLSNMYAEEGRWDKVEKVRELMKEKCVKKAPGQSSVGFG